MDQFNFNMKMWWEKFISKNSKISSATKISCHLLCEEKGSTSPNIFFFLIDKGNSLKAKKAKESIHEVYQDTKDQETKGPDPYLVANQFTKSNNDKV